MSDIHISSKNQSGGITGQNISTGNQSNLTINKTEKKEIKIKHIFWWVFGIIGGLSGVITILKYLFD